MTQSVEKLTPHSDGKKRRMLMNKLSAVALVDRGANPHADVTFFKSVHKPGDKKKSTGDSKTVEKRFGITSIVDNHQHVIDIMGREGLSSRGTTTWDDSHTHEWVKREDGSIVLLMADGHTHEIIENIQVLEKDGKLPEEGLLADLLKRVHGETSVGKKENTMSGNKNAPTADEHAAVTKSNEELTAKLAISDALASMDDATKAHYNSLDEDGKTAFIGKTDDQRSDDIKKASAENDVVYTSDRGEKFYKSDDDRMVSMAKEHDEDRKELIKQKALREDDLLEKRAKVELAFLPGDTETHVALLKAVDKITDTDQREEVMKTLIAKNANFGKGMKEVGTSQAVVEKASVTEANDELERLAKEHAAKGGIDFYDAYEIVSNSNPKLLKKANAS